MIKGINRQVIEVLDTGNIYYERALLVVRPEFAAAQREVLEKEARHMLGKMRAPSAIKKRRRFFTGLSGLDLRLAQARELCCCCLSIRLYKKRIFPLPSSYISMRAKGEFFWTETV